MNGLEQLEELLAGFPDWFIWRLEWVVVRGLDKGLAPSVQDALRELLK